MKSIISAALTATFLTVPFMNVASAATIPQIDHVIVVEFENTDYAKALKQPTFAKLAKEGANLTQFYAVTHPSQPNYIAMIAGSRYGVTNDKNSDIDARHLGDLLEEAGKTWKVYADGYPGSCFLGATSGKYARKHVPFLSFKNVQNDPERCARVVAGTELRKDVANDQLPNFSLYIPNLDNDGHDTGVGFADSWLKNTFMPMIKDKLPPKTLVVFTFDESSLFGGNHIYTAFYGDVVIPGSTYEAKTDHYGFLRTIESLFGLGDLGKHDATSTAIDGIWKQD